MITKLTKEQISRFPEFINKWTKIGLSTLPADRKSAELGIVESYKIAGLSAPKIVWCGSPLSQGLTRALVFGLKKSEVAVWDSVWDSVRASVRDSVGASVWDSVRASVRDSVGASVWDSVRASVWDSVRASVWDSVWDSVRASVWDSVWDSVRASVRASVRDSVRDSVWDSVWDSVRDSAHGQHDANWLGFYEYFKIVCGLEKETQELCGLWSVAQSAGWWLPHKGICWISERHNILNRNTSGRLHKDGGPALSYPDGFSIYALNGVRMDKKWVDVPAEQLDPSEVLKERNAEVRRELIRKVGVERLLALIPNKNLDTVGNYELLSVRLSDEVRDARYLKMVNPSIGCFHVEGVHPGCDTVEKALNFRNQNFFTNAEILT